MSFAAIDREISQLRNRIDTLKRKFHRELAITQARRVAEPIAQQWNTAEPPDPFQVGKRFTDAGCRSFAFANFHNYLYQVIGKGEVPNPITMVRKLLPYAWDHRYDNFFAFDLPPKEPRASEVKLPAWMLMH